MLIEGLACGCAVLTSRIAGIAETVTHGEHALLLDEPENPAEAIAHLLDIAAQPEKYAAMRAAGRQRARSLYDWRAIAGQVERIYFELSNAKSA